MPQLHNAGNCGNYDNSLRYYLMDEGLDFPTDG